MKEIKRPINIHNAYHAHVYFNDESKTMAKKLCEQAGERFSLKIGSFHEKLVGPHPCWSCQITFSQRDFDRFIPWLDEERGNLSILVHALTGDNLKDHTDFAYWLGQPEELNLSLFKTK